MVDYIDREALLRNLKAEWGHLDTHTAVLIESLIRTHHPVDAVEVVRCKDCKHRGGSFCRFFHKRVFDIGVVNHVVKDNDYCKWGEKE